MSLYKYTKLVSSIAISISIFALPCIAQDDAPRNIQVYTEMIEISALEYADIMTDQTISNDHTALRNKLIAQVKAGKATLISNQSLISRSGERATNESVRELIYQTEYEPSEPIVNVEDDEDPSSKPMLTVIPPTPTAFETRNTGTTLEVEAVMGADMKTIDILFNPEIVKQVGYHEFSEWTTEFAKTKVQFPIFYTMRIAAGITVSDGQFTLVGTHSPEVDGKPDNSKKLLIFVKASVLKVAK